jgi:AraC-like DNA-binding protein
LKHARSSKVMDSGPGRRQAPSMTTSARPKHKNRIPAWEPLDPLGEALHFLRVQGSFYCRSELTAPWGLTMPAFEGCLWFHAVLAGGCTLDVKGAPPVELGPGDFALVPRGKEHKLRTQSKVATPIVTDLPHLVETERYAVLEHGGGGARTTLVCGIVHLDDPSAPDLPALLPPLIHLPASYAPEAAWRESTLRLMAAEAEKLRPGGEAVLSRLADILVIQAVRAWLERDRGAERGWLGALRDPQIGRALMLVHRDPQKPWSVDRLAAAAAMSRSAFAARFTSLVEETPMQYVTRLRIHAAHELLERGTIAEVADRLGYRSEAAFSRAFKRMSGVSPGVARKARRAEA